MLLQPPTTDHATNVVEKMKEVNREVNNNTENSTSESRFRGKGGEVRDGGRSYRFVKSSSGHRDYQHTRATDTNLF